MRKTIYACNLTGTKMSQLGKVGEFIKPGQRLAIISRPDNSYDSQAMSVHFGDNVTAPQVGWIPAKQIEDKIVKGVLFNLVRHGIGLEATVVSYDPSTKELAVQVDLAEPEDEAGLDPEADDKNF